MDKRIFLLNDRDIELIDLMNRHRQSNWPGATGLDFAEWLGIGSPMFVDDQVCLGLIKPGMPEDFIHVLARRAKRLGLVFVPFAGPLTWSADGIRILYVDKINEVWWDDFLAYMTSDSMIPFIVCGIDACSRWREALGQTNPDLAAKGTIRGDYAPRTGKIMHNAVHSSDSPDRALEEIRIVQSQYGPKRVASLIEFLVDHPELNSR